MKSSMLILLAELPWGCPYATDHDIHEIDFLPDVSANFLGPQVAKILRLLWRHRDHHILHGSRDLFSVLHDTQE